MLHLLGLSGLVLVHLAFPAHGALVKRSAYQCDSSIANTYCRNHIQSSRNPSGNCIDGVFVCYMTSPICKNAADCEGACRPLGQKGIFVEPQCIRSQCRCEVSDQCTQASCEERCMIKYKGKIVQSSKCLPNNSCICSYYDPCTSGAGCRSVCEQKYPGKKITGAHCRSDWTCLCQYEDQCTQALCGERCMTQYKGKIIQSSKCLPNNSCICRYYDHFSACTSDADCRSACEEKYPGKKLTSMQCQRDHCLCEYEEGCTGIFDCRMVCAKTYPGKTMLSTTCGSDKQCRCVYLDGGNGTAIRPSVLTIAIILLTTLAMIPAPAEGKLGALLIPSAIFGLSTSQLAFG